MTYITEVDWEDIYPACLTFDADEVTTLLAAESPNLHHEYEYSDLLESRFGVWTCGWNWSNSEGGGGGLVDSTAYCCSDHSLKSYKNVMDGLRSWHLQILGLHDLFERNRLEDWSKPSHICAALQNVLDYVMEQTYCEDAWYNTFNTCVIWMFQSFELRHLDHKLALNILFPDGFHSWTSPTSAEKRTVFNGITASVEPWLQGLHTSEQEDGNAAWLTHRDLFHFNADDVTLKTYQTDRDGHLEFIHKYDDVGKKDGILAAIELSKSQRELPLSFDLLCSWISLINPENPAVFRTLPAFAKDGLEFYPYSSEVPFQFIQLINEETDVHFIERACKLYLDICFFHPFDDGNSRLARVAFDFILYQNGYKLLSAECAKMLFKTNKYASNAHVLKSMMDLTKLAITTR